MLRGLTVCRRIYDKPNPELREVGLHYQVRLLKALRAGDSEVARQIMFDHMCVAQDYMTACEAKITSGFLKVPNDTF